MWHMVPLYCRYVLAYMESVGFIKRNQTVMQIGMGGGMKAGVNVWRSLKDVQDEHLAWRHLNGVCVTGGWVLGFEKSGHGKVHMHLVLGCCAAQLCMLC